MTYAARKPTLQECFAAYEAAQRIGMRYSDGLRMKMQWHAAEPAYCWRAEEEVALDAGGTCPFCGWREGAEGVSL